MGRRDEAGAASVMVLALAFALMVLAGGAGSVVAAVVAHRAAQSAADLAALAAAKDVLSGFEGCPTATEVAVANHAQLVSCSMAGENVDVEVEVKATFGLPGPMHARARAGPASSTEKEVE